MNLLRIPGFLYEQIRGHLFPADGREAIAFALCGRREGRERRALLAREVFLLPHELCRRRERDLLVWPTEWLLPVLECGAKEGASLLRIHSHPGGFEGFSEADDATDRDVFPFASAYLDASPMHVSAVMVPSGKIVGRSVGPDGEFGCLDRVAVVGDRLTFMDGGDDRGSAVTDEAVGRPTQVLGPATQRALRGLTIAVAGCSGTGSHVVEQLARLGVGHLVPIDPECVEHKNLNRIVGATWADAEARLPKVHVARRNIEAMGFGTRVTPLVEDLRSPQAIGAVADADVAFGCVDGIAGRYLLARIASYYCLPYIDVGVLIEATPSGGLREMQTAVHYLQPGCSTLESREVYGAEALERDSLSRYSPSAYRDRVRQGYIHGADVEQPAVVSVNATAAGIAVTEFLLRLHGIRRTADREIAEQRLLLLDGGMIAVEEAGPRMDTTLGKGDRKPLLDLA